eukprot:gene1447-18421_t
MVTGQSWNALFTEQIATPLGLANSSWVFGVGGWAFSDVAGLMDA